ncbi:hypothetical protein GVN99_13700 [Serratia marcescens]|uniref:Acb2/Tad1 domain-containing protein n=1 Tax=Serratia TaxID=613 RepID=UPI000744FAAE|nr:hypothetical protein [Serratia marcescens]NSM20172.1 hypothetical protein [Serratia marcescens]NSM49075.1 hypothetical protein [Serratia marcescens]CVC81634.1 Uncharacterised protein [Serratia marcescens]
MPVIKAQSSHRQLSEAELAVMEELTALGNQVGQYLEGLAKNPDVDPRWLSIACTELQQGFMAVKRAVAKPAAF